VTTRLPWKNTIKLSNWRRACLSFLLLAALLSVYFYRLWRIGFYNKEEELVRLDGIIWDKPEVYYSTQQFWVSNYLVETIAEEKIAIGDRVLLAGKAECQPKGRYQERCVISYPEISVVKNYFGSGLVRFGFRVRESLIAGLERVLPSEPASLLTGIVWGNQGQFSKRFYEDMKASGLLHVVVASGANVLALADLLKRASRFLNRRLLVVFILPVIVVYGFIVGNDPPIVRAVLVSGIALISQLLGRQARPLRSLFLSGIAMIAVSPRLGFDISFQLSFGASLGILLFSNSFKRIFHWSDLATTLAAQVVTTPILALRFGEISPLSFLSNAFLLWLIEPLMIWGLGLTAFSLVCRPLANLMGAIFWFPLQVFIWGSHFWARLLPQIAISESLALGSFAVIFAFWFWTKKVNRFSGEQAA
jgi:ComEC/Rec2-related protein